VLEIVEKKGILLKKKKKKGKYIFNKEYTYLCGIHIWTDIYYGLLLLFGGYRYNR